MLRKIKSTINTFVVNSFSKYGFNLSKIRPSDVSNKDWELYQKIRNLTMTPSDRIFSLIEIVVYICDNKLDGDFVECGVWRGGNAVLMAEVASRYKQLYRKIWLYDTYDGMVQPDDIDVSFKGEIAGEIFQNMKNEQGGSSWSTASYEFVKQVLDTLEYPIDNFIMVKGMVEDSLSAMQNIPDKISLLRLDTDWYSSTKKEMDVLFPKLVKGGVLIIDDYGDWQGSRKAVDEYLDNHNIQICLMRLSSGARIGIKM